MIELTKKQKKELLKFFKNRIESTQLLYGLPNIKKMNNDIFEFNTFQIGGASRINAYLQVIFDLDLETK